MAIITKSVTEQIINYYAENIENGTWKVGEKTPSENQLVEELGVSRSSIRQAVSTLSGLGILESVHGKGTFILDNCVRSALTENNRITAEDCRDVAKVLEFRRIVESEACFIAAEKADDDLIQKLENCVQIMRANKSDIDIFVKADIDFHRMICQATENTILEKSMNRIFDENYRGQELTRKIFGYKDGIQYHEMIIQAMKEQDASRAREVMYEHLQNGIDKLEKIKEREEAHCC